MGLGDGEGGLGRRARPHRRAQGGVVVGGGRPVVRQAGPALLALLRLAGAASTPAGARAGARSPGRTSSSTASCSRAWRKR